MKLFKSFSVRLLVEVFVLFALVFRVVGVVVVLKVAINELELVVVFIVCVVAVLAAMLFVSLVLTSESTKFVTELAVNVL